MQLKDLSLPEILIACVAAQVSDIHLSRVSDGGEIRGRIYGRLTVPEGFSASAYDHLVSMVKLRAGMDLSVYHVPQDGRFSETIMGRPQDFRVSTLPTPFGEDVVIRVLHARERLQTMSDLGFSSQMESSVLQMLSHKSGLILVTGPTGSGKTTTLYTCLQHLADIGGRMVVSIEDPVEALLSGVRQTALNADIGYDAPRALKAILRQDPDVILVGEIRDAEMARLALEAAYTGHLVLSALHTSDVASSLRRMQGFGVDLFLLQHAVKGILSQRLMPVLCATCTDINRAACSVCQGTGIVGRRVDVELFIPENADYWSAFSEGKPATAWPGFYLPWDSRSLGTIASPRSQSLRYR